MYSVVYVVEETAKDANQANHISTQQNSPVTISVLLPWLPDTKEVPTASTSLERKALREKCSQGNRSFEQKPWQPSTTISKQKGKVRGAVGSI